MTLPTTHIAICYLGGGSVYGQSHGPEKAVEIAIREALAFAKAFGGFRDDAEPIVFSVFDYQPWESITWSDLQTYGYKTKDRSDEPTAINAESYVWVDPKTFQITKTMTRDEWLLSRAVASLG